MKFYEIKADGGWNGSTLDITEDPWVKTQGVASDTWCEADGVQKMRARLLVKLLRERAYVKKLMATIDDSDENRLKRTFCWCHKIAARIEEKYTR